MGTVCDFDHMCRLCGLESNDLVALFEAPINERDLVSILKKYLRVTVTVGDKLPHNICGPCLAKLDEVVDFVDTTHSTQTNLKKLLKGKAPVQRINDDRLYELIRDVKVELDEDIPDEDDDAKDLDYDPSAGAKKQRGRQKGAIATRKKAAQKKTGRPRTKPLKKKVSKDEADDQKEEQSHSEEEDDDDEKSSEEEKDEELENEKGKKKKTYITKNAVRCAVCKLGFSQPSFLLPHAKEVHQESEPRHLCPQCPRSFMRNSSLTNHLRKRHRDALQGCPQCHKQYPTHYLWTRHMLVHTNTRPYECDECGKKFKSRAELIHHKKVHRPNEERYTHCCEVCGKRFTQKANLDTHLRLHTGERPFSCEFCGKGFSQRGNMEEHRRIHTGEKPFVCELCGKSYARQGQLTMHRKLHAGIKPHKCQFCGKNFVRKEVLRKHEHVHTDTRPYKCSYCDKCFRDQGKRKVHERLHTGERPFECKFCGRGFCESGNLRKHMQVHVRRGGSSSASAPREQQMGESSQTSASTANTNNSNNVTSNATTANRSNANSSTSNSTSTTVTSSHGATSSTPSSYTSAYSSFAFSGITLARQYNEVATNLSTGNPSQASPHAAASSHQTPHALFQCAANSKNSNTNNLSPSHSMIHGNTGSKMSPPVTAHSHQTPSSVLQGINNAAALGGITHGAGGHPLAAMRSVEDSRARAPQSSCERDGYRNVAAHHYHPVPWALYHP